MSPNNKQNSRRNEQLQRQHEKVKNYLIKKNPSFDIHRFPNPYCSGSYDFNMFEKNMRDFQNIKFRNKRHVGERLNDYCSQGRFGHFNNLFPKLNYFQLVEGNYMEERDVFDCQPVNYRDRIFFKIENCKDHFKYVTKKRIFYQSVHGLFGCNNYYSLLFQVKMKNNCKIIVFKFDSKKRSKIFFLKENLFCFLTQSQYKRKDCITLINLHSQKVGCRLFFPLNEVDHTHNIVRVNACIMIIQPFKITFYQNRYPFTVRKIFSFNKKLVRSIQYLPSEEMFLFFVRDSKIYEHSYNYQNYRYDFLHDMTEEDEHSEDIKKTMRKLKKKYSDDPDSAFWYYVKQGIPMMIVYK